MKFLGGIIVGSEKTKKEIWDAKEDKCRRILNNNRISIEKRINDFDVGRQQLSFPEPVKWDEEVNICLRRLYDSHTNSLGALKEHVRDCVRKYNKFLKCPYCLITSGRVFDHFLDKARYPEYSIEPTNLVYVCNKCNEEKNWAGEPASDGIIYVYYDYIGDHSFLTFEVEEYEDFIVPSFGIDCDVEVLGEDICQRIKSHFENLELKSRFEAEAQESVKIFMDLMKRRKEDVYEMRQLIRVYRECAEEYRDKFGSNHYLKVLYEALAEHAGKKYNLDLVGG